MYCSIVSWRLDPALATMCMCRQVLGKDCRAVPAGGASEMEIARHLQADARKATGLEQYAIAKFAEALEVGSKSATVQPQPSSRLALACHCVCQLAPTLGLSMCIHCHLACIAACLYCCRSQLGLQ